MQGKRVCTVDLDPQHNLSRHFGILPGHKKNRPTIYDVINAAIQEQEDRKIEQLIKDCICHSTTVDVIPSTVRLSSLEKVIRPLPAASTYWIIFLSFIKNEYDYIFLDVHSG